MTAHHGFVLPPFVASPVPPRTMPQGYGCLVVSANRSPVMNALRFRVSGKEVLIGEGTSYVIVPAGQHEMTLSNAYGVTILTSVSTVSAGEWCHLQYQAGEFDVRAYDGRGVEVTMYSHGAQMRPLLIVLAGFAAFLFLIVSCFLMMLIT